MTLHRRLLMVCSVALVLAGCEVGDPGIGDRVAYPAPSMAKTLNDVPYGVEDQQVLDVYSPTTPNGGAVLWIHGGGWADTDGATNSLASEEQSGMQPVVQAMQRRGWTVFSVRYSGTDEAIFPKPLQDVKQAVRWVKAHAAEFGVSPTAIVAMGFSAGGHLAAMLGVTAGSLEPKVTAPLTNQTSKPAAVVSIAGVLDPATFAYRYGLPPGNATGVAALIGCPDTPQRWATCNPSLLQSTRVTAYDDAADAPIYIVQGGRDGIVDPQTQARVPYDAMVQTIGDDRTWIDLVDTGSPLSYAGLDPQNHSMALSYELNLTALTDFVGRVLPDVAPVPALSRYAPTTTCRLADSRSAATLTSLGSGRYRVQVGGRCGVPAGASGVVLTITIVRSPVAGGARVFATGAVAPAPIVTFAAGEVRANTTAVALSAKGTVDLSGVSGAVLVDVSGVYRPIVASRTGRVVATPAHRVLDTPASLDSVSRGVPQTVVATGAGVPADALAVLAVVSVSATSGAGHMAVSPAGTALPTVGVVTADAAGQARSATAWIALRNGRFSIGGTMSAHVTVDVLGYVTGSSVSVSQSGLFRAARTVFV